MDSHGHLRNQKGVFLMDLKVYIPNCNLYKVWEQGWWYINATCRASLSIYLSSCCLYSLIFSLLNLCLSMHSMFGYPEHVFCSYYMHREFVLLPLMTLEFEGAMNLRHSPRLGKTFNLGNLQLITVCMYIYTLICAVSPGKGIKLTLEIQTTAWAKLFTLTSKVYPVLQKQPEVTPTPPLPPKDPVEWGITA